MKKTILSILFCLCLCSANAIPKYYCGANGYCFEISNTLHQDGTTSVTVTYIGMCTGGPFVFYPVVTNIQDPLTSSMTEATINMYQVFSSGPTKNTYTPTTNDIKAACDASPDAKAVWFSVDKIDWLWAKTIAGQNNQTIFALKMLGNPVHDKILAEIYSTVYQNIQVQLCNPVSGEIAWSTTSVLNEGKNSLVFNCGSRNGTWVLKLKSDMNLITRNVSFY